MSTPLGPLAILQRLLTRAKLRHMQALIALDDLRSMGRAAQAMGMSQPAMSQLVAEFEQLIETRLFLRHSKGVDPTPAALDLIPVARRILAAAEEGAEHIASRNRREGGLVRVATTAAATGALLNRVLPEFAESHPNIQVQVVPVAGQTLDASFAEDEFDIVCCRLREVVPEGWTFCQRSTDELVAVCAASHPLAGRSEVTLAELGQHAWMGNHVATTARHHFDELRQRQNWTDTPEVQILSREPMLIWTMLKTGKALSLIPRSVADHWLDDGLLHVLPAALDMPLPPIGFHWRPATAGFATRRLVDALSATGDL